MDFTWILDKGMKVVRVFSCPLDKISFPVYHVGTSRDHGRIEERAYLFIVHHDVVQLAASHHLQGLCILLVLSSSDSDETRERRQGRDLDRKERGDFPLDTRVIPILAGRGVGKGGVASQVRFQLFDFHLGGQRGGKG